MPLLLATSGTDILLVALVALVYAGVLWMIFDVVTRPDFSGFQKILWIVFGLVFSLATLIVYVVWVRKRDYSRR
jgi:tryptophan-rich sensory protein